MGFRFRGGARGGHISRLRLISLARIEIIVLRLRHVRLTYGSTERS
jgi:hypothetical protein